MSSKYRVESTLQPSGWVVIWFGFAILLLIGVLLGDGYLLSFGCFYLLMLVTSYLWGRGNVKQLEVSVQMPERVHAAKGFELEIILDNHKQWLDSYAVDVDFSIFGKLSIAKQVSRLGAASGASLRERISIPSRGSATSFPGVLKSRFPFGFFEHTMAIDIAQNVIVYPRQIVPVELLAFGSLNEVDPQNGMALGEALGEPRGIRAWQPGDPAKRIHWQASARSLARGMGLRIREYDPPGFTPSSCSVLFHSCAQQGEVFRQDRFERSISLVAGALKYLQGQKVEVELYTDFLAWHAQSCSTRSELIHCLSLLAEAHRSFGSEVHELQAVIEQQCEQKDQVVVLSDIDPDSWAEGLELPENALLIDIRQIRFKRRSFNANQEVA